MMMMLAISPLSRPIAKDELDITSFSDLEDQFADFPEFSAPVGCLLDSIDFDGDVLPDLEMDPADFMADFSFSTGDVIDEEDADIGIQVVPDCYNKEKTGQGENELAQSGTKTSKDDDDENEKSTLTRSGKEKEKEKEKEKKSRAKKSNSSSNEGKRKTKVDWTPELHRRFVEAVELLGLEKAVPSRILDLMGIHCLTRHNVASHLQKYRSHRKHLLAREAEAASWTQKRQMYGIAVTPATGGGGGGCGGKTKANHTWHSPAVGFPPMTPAPPPIQHHHRHRQPHRPLHVWGHPTPHHTKPQMVMPLWPKQPTPTFWHPHHHHGPNVVTTSSSCFPRALPATRFAAASPVPGVPPPHHAMYKHQPSPPGHPPIDLHPTKESIDAVLGDVLSKPWLPLPIGLKPPSIDSVMVELHRQGVPKIPPS